MDLLKEFKEKIENNLIENLDNQNTIMFNPIHNKKDSYILILLIMFNIHQI